MSISALAAGEKSDDHLAQVAKFIPTEVVAIYVAIASIFNPIKVSEGAGGNDLPVHTFDFTSRWVLFYAMLGATPILTLLIFRYRVKTDKSKPIRFDRRKWLVASFYSMLALAVWATALADTPWQDFEWWKAAISTTALLIFTLIVPLLPGTADLDKYADDQVANETR